MNFMALRTTVHITRWSWRLDLYSFTYSYVKIRVRKSFLYVSYHYDSNKSRKEKSCTILFIVRDRWKRKSSCPTSYERPVTSCERQTKASSMLFLQSNSYNDRCITAYKLRHRKTESTHWSKILTNIVYPRVNSFTDSANFLTGWFGVRRSHISGVKITEIRYNIQLSCRVARNLNLSNFEDNEDSKFANILHFQRLFTY